MLLIVLEINGSDALARASGKETRTTESAQPSGFTPRTPPEHFPFGPSNLRLGMVVETAEIRADLADALQGINAEFLFECRPGEPIRQILAAVERDRPELIFVETALLEKATAEWISEVRRGGELPLIVAIHPVQDPGEMIRALRGGATEFLSLPVRPSFLEAMDRAAVVLEAHRAKKAERGKTLGFLSAKGGCGASTIGCYVTSVLSEGVGGQPVKCLFADLDMRAGSSAALYKVAPRSHVFQAFDQVRQLTSNSWRDLVVPVSPHLDLLGGMPFPAASVPEDWKIESLFRFASRNYGYVCADLGRQLTPSNWVYLHNIEELFLITGPDVLALYQTRAVLQALTNRGFEKSRLRLILNLNQSGPQDFWKESIEQMFELQVYFCLPHDEARHQAARAEKFEFPTGTEFGRHLAKLAAKIAGVQTAKSAGSGFFRRF